MFGGQDDVLLPGRFCQLDDLVGVVFDRVELRRQLFIVGDRDFGAQHDPFADAGDMLALPDAGRDAVDAPVDEHAEFGFAPPIQPRVYVGAGPLAPFGFEVFDFGHFRTLIRIVSCGGGEPPARPYRRVKYADCTGQPVANPLCLC